MAANFELKALVEDVASTERLIDKSQVLFVQASPDVETPQAGHWLFEIIGGSKDEPFGIAWFVVSHAIESTAGHQMLKH